MWRHRHLIAVIALVLPSTANASFIARMAQVREAWESRQKQYMSWHVVWKEEVTYARGAHLSTKDPSNRTGEPVPPAEMTLSLQRDVLIDGEKIRVKDSGRAWSGDHQSFMPYQETRVWDGNVGREVSVFNDRDAYDRGVQYTDARFITSKAYFLPICWCCRAIDEAFLPNDLVLEEYAISDDEATIDGRACVVLQRHVGEDRVRSYWLDMSRDFIVLRHTFAYKGRSASETNLDYSDQPPYPVLSWTTVEWDADGNLKRSALATVQESQVNPTVTVDDFQTEFPVGTVVFEVNSGLQYVAGSGNEKRVIEPYEWERGATYQDILATESGMARAPVKRTGIRVWLFVGGLGVALSLLYAVTRRFQKSSA